MRSARTALYVMGVSFLLVDMVYLYWSLQAHNFEVVGLIMMGLSAMFCIGLAFYFGRTVNAMGTGVLAEDRTDTNIDDGDAELGHFSPWSWWPSLLAGAVAVTFLGVALSAWIAIIAVPSLTVSLIGWVFEHYRGYFAR